MQYKIDENTIWEDTGLITVHNFPVSSRCTYSYITRRYREYKKGTFGWKEVEGNPIYFNDMTPEQLNFAVIMGTAQNALNTISKHEEHLIPITTYKNPS